MSFFLPGIASRPAAPAARAARSARSVPAAVAVALAVALTVLLAGAPGAAAQTSDDADEAKSISTLEGVYTTEQAEEGREVYEESCAMCHATAYFTASAFERAWSGRAIYWLFNRIHTIMPEDNPGSLRPREVADILAYVLQLNGYPAGEMELPDDGDLLRGIVWEALPKSPESGDSGR